MKAEKERHYPTDIDAKVQKKARMAKKYQNKFVTLGLEILEQENVPVSEHVP